MYPIISIFKVFQKIKETEVYISGEKPFWYDLWEFFAVFPK